jgi:hypothetical protein
MKIAIVNNTGNVGKTTIAREVFAINMDNPTLIEIETHNAGNQDFENYFSNYKKFTAEQVAEFYEELMLNENAIIDVGASNMVEFFKKLIEYGINDIFDKIIVPVTPDSKQLKDALKTIFMLIEIGTNQQNIYVIANRVKSLINFEKDFKAIINASKELGFNFNSNLIIKDTTIFKDLEDMGKILKDVVNDDNDYIKLAMENPNKKSEYIKLDLIKRAGKTLANDLKNIYDEIMK